MSAQLNTKTLLRLALFLFAIWLFFAGLYFAKSFLLPLTFAGLIAMLLWPICQKLESWGMARTWASLTSLAVFLLIIAGVFTLLGNQIRSFGENIPQIQDQFTNQLDEVQSTIADKFGIPKARQKAVISNASNDKSQNQMAKQVATTILGGLTTSLLTFVYIFLLLLYRSRFKEFILKYTDKGRRGNMKSIINEAATVAKSYLIGRLLLMLILAGIYCGGLTLIGIPHALFFGLLAALLAIIPFIGNIIGAALPVAMAFGQGYTNMVIWVIALFSAAQLLENYILEPMVVGRKVDLNAFFSIAVVILGEMLWGVPGAVLAMPVLGIFKIMFDHLDQFKPIGYLIGEGKDNNIEEN